MSSPVKIKIHDFQSIENLEFEVSGFTCITGPTNIGKSAIIRAISGAILGAPVVGDVRKGSKFCSVDISSDDWSMKWEKGERGVNRYWIPIDAEKPLDKVGQGQIEQVASLGFGSVQVGSESIQPWFASQFEPIFLMNKSGPAVTDFLSEVSRLKVLQNGITINVRNRKRLLERSKIRDEDAKLAREKEESLSGVSGVVQLKKDLGAQMESILGYEKKIKSAKRFQSDIETETKSVEALLPVKEVKLPSESIRKRLDSLRQLMNSYTVLEYEATRIIAYKPIKNVSVPDTIDLSESLLRLSKAEKLDKEIEAEKKAIALLSKSVDVPEAPNFPSNLKRMIELMEAIEYDRSQIASMENSLSSMKTELTLVQSEIDSIEVCPTCKRPLAVGH